MRQKPGTKQSRREKVVEDTRRTKRKQYSVEKKIRIGGSIPCIERTFAR